MHNYGDINYASVWGNFGEKLVSEYLVKNGFKVLHRNYRQRYGEIDLIAEKNEVVAFVEVKFRQNEYFSLSDVITRSKQKKIILAAKRFISMSDFVDKVFRFDVALILKEGDNFRINYIENAFVES
ncbi:YraN family protein [candidate division TM6 bacterium RIFCSPHIGHO2_12_FULL_32_22]|nr:MAG: YraN family protein [candidate division TM6 bacterium RIFCSPHIGHO2_12_FULL_32_22]